MQTYVIDTCLLTNYLNTLIVKDVFGIVSTLSKVTL